ncbi:LpxI family protein [Mangrovibrevibacter kandeliae]|uniref:LpxI family protein n=1 Tax=Mangrovibrevibacter kandeliae TaxID=2968473 RepID=UPI00211767A2|nr:UDP-2,3-diacylglucosamine diphosphatase LpxI [Aurantimonas sp. CSK15Z-1]
MERSSPRVLGIVAGGGDLPRLVAQSATLNGWVPLLVRVGDGLHQSLDIDSIEVPWGRVGDAIETLRGRGVRHLVFCGTISIRPDFRSIVPSLRTLALLPTLFRVVRGGDDTLLRGAARGFESRGFEVLAVQDIAPELLVPAGPLTSHLPGGRETAALDRAFAAAARLGALDIGQAVVASPDRVIALEGIEGTQEMLARVADLRRRGRIGRKEPCVLVKAPKPQQDHRFDLPSIGAATIELAAEAGLVGIGLGAGAALVIGLDDVLAAAARHGLFVIGRAAAGDGDAG